MLKNTERSTAVCMASLNPGRTGPLCAESALYISSNSGTSAKGFERG